ncbi:TlpA family protein disulfide reductase [Leucothrix sargassi]|nr:TlpA family protein disulfide reductase [Leucothrix sargassi]
MVYLRSLFLTIIMGISTAAFAEPVEDFTFFDVDNQPSKLSDYRGKWVIANYWAIFCSPCRVEIPDLIRFVDNNPEKVVVLGMDAGMDDTETLKAFIEDQGINYPIIPTQDSTMYGFGEVRGIPTSFVISPDGELVDTHVGILSYNDLESLINPEKGIKGDDKKDEKGFWDKIFDWS